MINGDKVNELVKEVKHLEGKGDKTVVQEKIKKRFNLTKDGSVYFNDSFALRFSKSESKSFSNTVLALSKLQKFDDRPFFVIAVGSAKIFMLLANTTFLKKISHSSSQLRMDNIRGSFNGSDIMHEIDGVNNEPENFEDLYAYHEGISTQDNLERLVESTNSIEGRIKRFEVTEEARSIILDSVHRADSFIRSLSYQELKEDLNLRVSTTKDAISVAAFIENINIRGRVIEYLITENDSSLKDQILASLKDGTSIPNFRTADGLGDYHRNFQDYITETDIKTKVLFLQGNPKAYNVDKMLRFLAEEKSVYLIFLIGIEQDGTIVTRLCSIFDQRIISGTTTVHHWAGRNSRGVTQFYGPKLVQVLTQPDESKTHINKKTSQAFIEKLMK